MSLPWIKSSSSSKLLPKALMPRHPRSLKILNWIASSVISRKAEFQHLLHKLNIDIACVFETFLKPYISFCIPHYSIYRTYRVLNRILSPTELDFILPKATTDVLAIGDFNAKNTTYHCKSTNGAGVALINYANLKLEIQLHVPSEPTRSPVYQQNPDILDITISIN